MAFSGETYNLSSFAFKDDGRLKSLPEQYGEVGMMIAQGEASGAPGPYIIAIDGAFTQIPQMQGKPIVIKPDSLKHILKKHGATIEVLSNLASEIAENVLCFENHKNPDDLTFILSSKSSRKNNFITAIRADRQMRHVEVSAITTVYGKDRDRVFKDIAKCLLAGRKVYANNRTGAWMEVLRSLSEKTELTAEVLERLHDDYIKSLAVTTESVFAIDVQEAQLPIIGSLLKVSEKNELDPRTQAELGNTGFAQIDDEAKDAPNAEFENPFAKTANAPGDAATPAEQERAKAAAKAQGKVLPGYQRMRGMGRDA